MKPGIYDSMFTRYTPRMIKDYIKTIRSEEKEDNLFKKITPIDTQTKIEEIQTGETVIELENLKEDEDIYVIAEDVKEEDYYTFQNKKDLSISDGSVNIRSDISFEALEREVDKIMG